MLKNKSTPNNSLDHDASPDGSVQVMLFQLSAKILKALKNNGDLMKNVMEETQWKEKVVLETDFFDLLCIVGNLALSLKHPKNNGPASKRARELGKLFATTIYDRFREKLPQELLKEWENLGFISSKKIH